jgi:putative ABC transport system permease protein
MNGLLQDLRYAMRQLRRAPGFVTVAVLILALGLGANTAIFSMLDQILLRELPVKDADRLVILRYTGDHEGHVHSRDDEHLYFSYPMYRDLRDRSSVFDGMIATSWAQAGLEWQGQPELVNAELVSGNYFAVLGLRPARGRLFVTADDVTANANPLVVLSFNYWQRRFGADPAIISKSIHINGHPFTVIGVAQPGFHSVVVGDTPDIFVPMTMKGEVVPGWNDLEDRKSSWLNIIARVKPEVRPEQAAAAISGLWYSVRTDEIRQNGSHSEQYIKDKLAKSHLEILPGSKGLSSLRKDAAAPLLIIMGMAGVMALMACANVSSMLLVRAAGRAREMSVRYALGAKPERVFRQLLVEGLLLGLIGGVLGVLLAPQLSAVLARMIWASSVPGDLPVSSHLDMRIIVFNFVLAIAISILFSLAPAFQFWRPDLTSALKQQVVSVAGSFRFRRLSVGVQIGLSVLLLIVAALFVRTLRNLESLDVGFATDHLVTFSVDPTLAGYPPDKAGDLDTRLLQTLPAIPGVHAVAATTDPELAGDSTGNNITIAGYVPKEGENMNVEHSRINAGYFAAMQMPLLAGREFNDQDRAGTQKVAMVNESFARRFFGEPLRALDRTFGNGGGNNVKIDTQIIGVVKDAKHAGVRQEVVLTIFTPYLQDVQAVARHPGGMAFYVRTWQESASAEETIRRAVHEIDSKLVLDGLRTMREQVQTNLVTERAISLLASAFGILAIVISGTGLYGVLAYSTSQRTREIGVRIALGADRRDVIRMVLIDVLWLAGVSIAVAIPASLLLTRLVRAQLFGVSSSDPLTLIGTTTLVATVALVAATIPARRAAKVDPMVALRYE